MIMFAWQKQQLAIGGMGARKTILEGILQDAQKALTLTIAIKVRPSVAHNRGDTSRTKTQ
ncbi:hypothetical protein CW304_12080 [Bacillus sp. UFRGS-B20]|nr:hypothetical protein CW304_12080 [Bacillus sp. UFRGS-B20]